MIEIEKGNNSHTQEAPSVKFPFSEAIHLHDKSVNSIQDIDLKFPMLLQETKHLLESDQQFSNEQR